MVSSCWRKDTSVLAPLFPTELKSGGPGDGGGAPLIDPNPFQLPLNW